MMQGTVWEEFIDKILRAKLDWEETVPCKALGPAKMYPASEAKQNRIAEQVCMKCNSIRQCLVVALATEEVFGVWGGTSEKQRAALRKEINTSPPDSKERIQAVKVVAMKFLKGRTENDKQASA